MADYNLPGSDLKYTNAGSVWDLSVNSTGDLETAAGLDNLVQALVLRLNTHRGELKPLGHPEYGSRLPELIGLPNNATTRNLVRLYTLECIKQEPRVQAVKGISVDTTPEQGKVLVNVSVMPIGETTALNLVFPFYLNE